MKFGCRKMTVGNISVEEKKSRRGKQLVDEKAPLLPEKQVEEGSFDEFNGSSFTGGSL